MVKEKVEWKRNPAPVKAPQHAKRKYDAEYIRVREMDEAEPHVYFSHYS